MFAFSSYQKFSYYNAVFVLFMFEALAHLYFIFLWGANENKTVGSERKFTVMCCAVVLLVVSCLQKCNLSCQNYF